MARIPRLGGRVALHAMANVGVHPADALPGIGVRVRCVNRADNVPRKEGRRRHVRRPGDQEIGGEMQAKMILALALGLALSGLCVAGCPTRPSDSEAESVVAEMIKTSFKTSGQAAIDRLKQDDAQ